MKSYSQALNILKKGKIIIDNELIKSSDSLNRVCASDVISKNNYPKSDNSSLDGYAINSKDTKNLSKKNIGLFKILGTVSAGDKPKFKKVKKFQTVEIMTGALIPKGFDAVIPLEQISFYKKNKNLKFIKINKKIKKNENVRLRGSDFKKKKLILKKGVIIESKHILAFKTLGMKKIKVKKIPNILFFSTGNEVSEKEKIPPWKVRNSNYHYLKSISNNFFFNFNYGGILRDNDQTLLEKQIKKTFKSKIDIVITSGGVSAGKHDYVPSIINKFKISNNFKGISIRPGKPVLFAKIKKVQKAIFGLPGNPISTAACFRFFVFPYLQNLLGLKKERSIKAILKNDFKKKINFTRFIKSKLSTTLNGKVEVELLAGQESFRIKPFIKSNAWAVLHQGKSNFKKGQIIECFLSEQHNKIFI